MSRQAGEMLKVLITVPAHTTRGGVTSYYTTLREHLSEETQFFVVGDRFLGTPDSENVVRRIIRLLMDYFHFVAIMCRGVPDIVHINPSFKSWSLIRDGLFLLLAKAFGSKVLVFFRGWDKACADSLHRHRRWLWLFRSTYFRADACIVLAGAFREQLIEMGYSKAIYCETTIVDNTCFEDSPALSLSRDNAGKPFSILFLGRVEKEKGVLVAVEAYAKLAELYPCVSLVVAGDGSALAEAKSWVACRQIPNVAFPGFVQDEQKREAFQQAACYIFPSYYGEGMPNSVLEAMAYGLPIVTTPVGGIKDFFEDSQMGFLVDSLEPKVFAEKLELLLNNPELGRRIGLFNRTFAHEEFAASKVSRRLQAIYSQLLSTPSNPRPIR